MIKNEHQYRVTRNLTEELEEALARLSVSKEYKASSKPVQKAHASSLKRQLAQYQSEIKEYETLKTGKFNFEKLPEIAEIPKWLIQARIAKGLGQEDLAKLLNLKKQQVQQYEATDYAAASLARLQQVAEVLMRR
jgi:ribosome-binding protein aMBF1 (putative translation factor)